MIYNSMYFIIWVAFVEIIRVSAWDISIANWDSQTRVLFAKLKFSLNSTCNSNSIALRILRNCLEKKFEPFLFNNVTYNMSLNRIFDNINYVIQNFKFTKTSKILSSKQ